MSSCSDSAKSNGSLFVSAKTATRNIKNATGCRNTFHIPICASTISFSLNEPVSKRIPITESPSAISYEIICAEERRPPKREYLLFELHPPKTTPYTPIDVIAKMNNIPMPISATWNAICRPNASIPEPKGTTANVTKAGASTIAGAR